MSNMLPHRSGPFARVARKQDISALIESLEDEYTYIAAAIDEDPYVPSTITVATFNQIADDLRAAYASAGTPEMDRIVL